MTIAEHDLVNLLLAYGYLAVFALVGVESMGIPLPGETMLITAALFAGSTQRLSIVFVIAAAAAGAILGDNAGFWVGHEGGYRLLRRYGRYLRLNERKLKLGQHLFRKHGGKVVFFGRFVSILRTYAAFLAGVNRMPWPRFLAFNAAGGVVWATLYGLGAYLLGSEINRLSRTAGTILVLAAVVLIAAFLVYLRRHERELEEEAVRELPGPV